LILHLCLHLPAFCFDTRETPRETFVRLRLSKLLKSHKTDLARFCTIYPLRCENLTKRILEGLEVKRQSQKYQQSQPKRKSNSPSPREIEKIREFLISEIVEAPAEMIRQMLLLFMQMQIAELVGDFDERAILRNPDHTPSTSECGQGGATNSLRNNKGRLDS